MTDDKDKPERVKTLGEALDEMGWKPANVGRRLTIRSGEPGTERLKLYRLPGTLRHVRHTLLQMKEDLEARGIVHLWVFGSVARKEQGEYSDVDLIVEIAPEADMSLTGFARLQADLTDALQRKADLTQWHLLSAAAAVTAQRDAVPIF
jgi:predicted nucleotidyltransferase